ncbi:MAG: hypothetical protein RBS73_10900 [Prolixibacteraceae bacterium]|jgi:hypothetical protein|nr:hypothetical protein [Prolixibacteraceae bacterium]
MFSAIMNINFIKLSFIKMKKRFLGGIAILGIALLVFTGCEKMPEAEIQQAQSAIDSAKAVGADIYLAEAFAGVQDTMKVAMEKIEEQNSKWFKKYSVAKAKLVVAATMANEIKEKTIVRKEELKAEIAQVYAETKALLEEDTQLLAKAPRGKGGAAIIEEIKTDIATTTEWIEAANTDIKDTEYLVVLDKMKAAKEKALSIKTELTEAIDKVSAAKRK